MSIFIGMMELCEIILAVGVGVFKVAGAGVGIYTDRRNANAKSHNFSSQRSRKPTRLAFPFQAQRTLQNRTVWILAPVPAAFVQHRRHLVSLQLGHVHCDRNPVSGG